MNMQKKNDNQDVNMEHPEDEILLDDYEDKD